MARRHLLPVEATLDLRPEMDVRARGGGEGGATATLS